VSGLPAARLLAAALLLAAAGLAQAAEPALDCRLALAQGAVAAFDGESSTLIHEAALEPANSAAGAAWPAHCAVRGIIGAHVGPPGRTAYGNRFLLRLPLAWNGRLVFQGGGGNNGVVGDARGLLPSGEAALNQGYAVVAQDSGHQGREPLFALDAQAYRDFAHAGVHKATVVAKALLPALAGRQAERAYFVGCSNGGREALASAQRHDDFDGVVAGSPGLATYDQWLHNLWALRVVSRLAGTAPGERPRDTSAAFSDAQLAAVADHFLHQCDALDGLADGLVQRPEACTASAADWQALRCAEADGRGPPGACLSKAQAEGLAQIYEGARDSAGRLIFPGFYPGHIERGLRAGYLGEAGSAFPLGGFYRSVMRNFVFMGYGHQGWPGASGPRDEPASYPDDALDYVARFDFDREPARLAPGRLDFHADNADPARPGPNFQAFQRRGGRMLLYTGTADNGVQPAGITQFMQRLHAQHGASDSQAMAALFLVPGMQHCRGGDSTERFDPLAALVAWVEQGQRPQQLLASAAPGSALDRRLPGASRPLCPWPRWARYKGQGDPAAASSFECTAP